MAKMFYTTDEAAAKLGVSPDGLKQFISENKLREFRDGPKVMFKVDQVDRLASERGGGAKQASAAGAPGLSDSGLSLGGTGGHDVISLADSTPGAPATSKEDTVVTGQGVSVFDKGEVKAADSSAQTQIQSAIDDQLSLEGVGSGSGLLDLTRESDDTSLGAELLDEIYPGGDTAKADSSGGSASGIFEPAATTETSGPSGLENMAASPAASAIGVADVVEEYDSTAGAFGGLALASALVMVVVAVIVGSLLQGFSPSWVEAISGDTTKVLIFTGVLLIVSALFAGVGFFVGKASR